MKKQIIALILAGMTALALGGCKEQKTDTSVSKDSGEDTVTETVQDKEETKQEEMKQEKSEQEEPEGEEAFSFADLKHLQFVFSSGAGAWGTELVIQPDGSFSGEYHDSEMGDTGEGYPNGSRYQCVFNGKFTQPVKVNDYTYSMQIAEMNYEKEVGKEEILDGILYRYTDVYGFDDAKDILIYLPGAPLSELSEEFKSWIYYELDSTDKELPFYALNNEANQQGFFGYDETESLREMIDNTEKSAAELENSIENDSLTQAEYNEKSGQLFKTWDYALNVVWDTLKRTKGAEEMEKLTAEEVEWIEQKEQKATEAGAEYEGGSMQPMAENLKAAEMTKERVYELMKLLDGTE